MTALSLVYRRRRPDATRRLRASFHVLSHEAGAGFVQNPKMPSVVLDHGRLIVGGTPVHTARFTADHITWVQQSPGRYTSGHLYVHQGGLGIHGIVYHGTTHADAVRHDIVGTVVKPVAYKTRITRKAYPASTNPATIPDSEWQDGLALTISYELGVGDTLPSPKVTLDGQDIDTQYMTWSIDAQSRTVLSLQLDDVMCMLDDALYRTATIAFDMYVPVPTGTGSVTALCGDSGPVKDGTVRFWKADPVPQTALFAAPAVENIAPTDVMAATDVLTINELMTILPDETVNDDSNSMFLRNMKWAMGQDSTERDWLKNFFGETPPTIDEPDQQALVKQSLDWYQNQFAKAYLTKSFNQYDGPNAPEHRLDQNQSVKLDSFLKEGLAQSKDFNIQHQGIFVDAYIGAKPRLRTYINDGGNKWAKQLFDVLTNGPQFVLMVNRVSGASGDSAALGPLNNFACLLTALQPSGELARDYYQSVMSGVIVKLVPQTSQSDRDTVMQWLPTVMQELLRKLANGELPDEVNISKEEGLEMYQEYIKHQNEITGAMADLLQSIVASNLIKQTQQFEQGFESIAQKYPKLAKAGKLFLVIGWAGGVASIITALVKGDWKKMTDVEKAEFVTECVQSVVQAFDAVPVLYNGVKGLSVSAWNKLMEKWYGPEQQTSVENLGQKVAADDDWVVVSAEETAPLLRAGALGRGTLYARLFGEGILAGVVKILGAVAAAAMAGWSLWQLINDIKSKGSVSTIVFDSLMFAANFLSAVCLVVDLFVATSFLPILGAVLAIAGLIIAFLAGFLEKPKNPVDEWMTEYGIPFVNGISLPQSNVKPVRVNLTIAPIPV